MALEAHPILDVWKGSNEKLEHYLSSSFALAYFKIEAGRRRSTMFHGQGIPFPYFNLETLIGTD